MDSVNYIKCDINFNYGWWNFDESPKSDCILCFLNNLISIRFDSLDWEAGTALNI